MTDAASPSPPAATFRIASALGFGLLGGVLSLYGPAVPLLRAEHGLSTAVAGMALPVHAVTSLVGVVGWGSLDQRGRARPALAVGAVAAAIGATVVAAAPSFAVVLLGVAAIGLGFGVVNTGINALFSRDRTEGAAARMNRLHATFGLGAVVFPILLSFTDVTVSFLTVAVLTVSILPGLWRAHDPGVPPRGDDSQAARRSTRVILIGFVTLFVLYIGVEQGVGNWMAAHVTDAGWSPAAAARWTAAYYLAFTSGRLIVARLLADAPPGRLVPASLALGAGCVALATVDGIAPLAYVLTGLAVSPVFPTSMVWIGQRLPAERHGPAIAILAAGAGGAVLPALIGAAVGVGGTQIVPVAITVVAVAATAAALWVRSTTAMPAAS